MQVAWKGSGPSRATRHASPEPAADHNHTKTQHSNDMHILTQYCEDAVCVTLRPPTNPYCRGAHLRAKSIGLSSVRSKPRLRLRAHRTSLALDRTVLHSNVQVGMPLIQRDLCRSTGKSAQSLQQLIASTGPLIRLVRHTSQTNEKL